MSNAIFPDQDLRVRLARAPLGVLAIFACGRCENEVQVLHTWSEVRAMLDGHPVNEVQMTEHGWIVRAPKCRMCSYQNKYRVSYGELKRQAESEMAARQRVQPRGVAVATSRRR